MSPNRSDDDVDITFRSPKKQSHAVFWILLLVGGGGLVGLFACCGCGVAGYFLFRDTVTDTTWRGSENLAGFGPLTFEFKQKGVAIMTDARGVVRGTWVRDGARITITFANCVYRGTIDGNTITGTANFSNFQGGPAWPFFVKRD